MNLFNVFKLIELLLNAFNYNINYFINIILFVTNYKK